MIFKRLRSRELPSVDYVSHDLQRLFIKELRRKQAGIHIASKGLGIGLLLIISHWLVNIGGISLFYFMRWIILDVFVNYKQNFLLDYRKIISYFGVSSYCFIYSFYNTIFVLMILKFFWKKLLLDDEEYL